MTPRQRSWLSIVVSAAALIFIVGALWPRGEAVETEAQRVEHVASRIRCPFCNGESIAEATSQVARDLEVVIGEQVAAGKTDDEIFDFFAARYGESLLLDPPLLGWGWALWVLPLIALGVGVFGISRRKRRSMSTVVAPASDLEAAGVEQQLVHVALDQREVAEQQAIGEIDRDTALGLTSALDAEASTLREALARGEDRHEAGQGTRRNNRVLAGVGLLVAGAIAVGATLVVTSDNGGDGGVVDAPPIDLASITSDRLEEVIADNPDIVPMRLLLAQMLTEELELLRAAQHLGEVLQRDENHPEALALLGWISFLVEEHATAEEYLVDALAILPDYPQAQWWLANVRFLGLGDPVGAIEPLEYLLAMDDVPAEVRQAAEQMLQLARQES